MVRKIIWYFYCILIIRFEWNVEYSNIEVNHNFRAGPSQADKGFRLSIGTHFEDSNVTAIYGDQRNNMVNDSSAIYIIV